MSGKWGNAFSHSLLDVLSDLLDALFKNSFSLNKRLDVIVIDFIVIRPYEPNTSLTLLAEFIMDLLL